MKNAMLGFLTGALVICTIYGSYYVVKTVSYSLFYKSMVESTVEKMVKSGCLKVKGEGL